MVPIMRFMLSMLKILIHVDVKEVYVDRISVGFNNFNEAPVKLWNEQMLMIMR